MHGSEETYYQMSEDDVVCIVQVVLNVGLCIALWDIEKREESYILPGDGGSHTKVHFRFVVFRPFMEQILIGKIKNSSRQGVQSESF